MVDWTDPRTVERFLAAMNEAKARGECDPMAIEYARRMAEDEPDEIPVSPV